MKCKVCGYEYRGLFCPRCDAKNGSDLLHAKNVDILKGYDFDIGSGLCVEEVFLIDKRGIVVTGTVKNMEFSLGQEVFWVNEGKRKGAVIAGIENHKKMVNKAKDGDKVGILLQNVTNEDIRCGCLLFAISDL